MDYTTLITNVRNYLDVDSVDISDSQMDIFFRLCESKINRALRTMDMVSRKYIMGMDNVEYYSVPNDFAGIREIKVNDVSLKYITPELQTNVDRHYLTGSPRYFSITDDKFRIQPAPGIEDEIEIIYYQKVPPLGPDIGGGENNNWLTLEWPDIYFYGLLYEANAFMYDEPKMSEYRNRFESAMMALKNQDLMDRWSGPLETRVIL